MWHTKSSEQVLEEVASTSTGLVSSEVESRKILHGKNELPAPKQGSIFLIFLNQFMSPIIYVLVIATCIVFILGDIEDGIIISIVLLLNAIIGTVQEGRAENTIIALRKLVTTDAVVFRNGVEEVVSDTDIVVGDILILQEGDKIPADARILSCADLNVDESSMTGESETVRKTSAVLTNENLTLGDQTNMVFKGTYCVGGEARAIVIATGVDTIIGQISTKLSTIETDVPLKAHIEKLSRQIIIAVIAICILIFIIGILKGFGVREMFASVVAICISAIPEGLPVVVTVILATGMYRMSKRNALVKRLQAVEALGQADVVAVDKTGTITLNQMMVTDMFTGGKLYEVSGNGYTPEGSISEDHAMIEPLDHQNVLLMGKLMGLCTSASIAYKEDTKEWVRRSGDPTDAAMLVLSEKIGFHKNILEQEYKKVFEIPFTSNLKYHAVAYDFGGGSGSGSGAGSSRGSDLVAIGAPEVLIEQCTHIFYDDISTEMTVGDKESVNNALADFLQKGLRVLVVTMQKDVPNNFTEKGLENLSFVGLVGMSDTIRAEIHEVVLEARAVGVRTIMITGDHLETAKIIAQKAGIYHEGDMVLLAEDLKKLSIDEINQILPKVSVFARVTPEQKLLIIEAYRRNGNIIAMTGDGVNDAMSLAAADLGIAMGKSGTEVAKEAADIILLDDNFTSIIAAIDEGRHIYNTIRKVILYLFAMNLGGIVVITFAIIAGYPIPLSPSQIIWLNFITDGFLVIAISLEPKEQKALLAPIKGKKLMDRAMVYRIMLTGLTMAIGTLVLFTYYLKVSGILIATTVALTTLAVFQWVNAWNVRSESMSIFSSRIFANRYLNISIFIVIFAQFMALYNPFLQKLLDTTPLDGKTWLTIISVGATIIVVDEIRKYFVRRRKSV